MRRKSRFALDRLSRYEITLWRQVAQTLFALDCLDAARHRRDGIYRSVDTKGAT